MIEKNKMVTLSYNLTDKNNDDLIEKTTKDKPLKFVFGLGEMLPMFEKKLLGLSSGDNFEMIIPAKDGYGLHMADRIVDLDKNIFISEGKFDDEAFKIGNLVPMQTSTGQMINGLIKDISDISLKMDFNHPLAGVDLQFIGNIIDIREATTEEIKENSPCICDGDDCKIEKYD